MKFIICYSRATVWTERTSPMSSSPHERIVKAFLKIFGLYLCLTMWCLLFVWGEEWGKAQSGLYRNNWALTFPHVMHVIFIGRQGTLNLHSQWAWIPALRICWHGFGSTPADIPKMNACQWVIFISHGSNHILLFVTDRTRKLWDDTVIKVWPY